MSYVCEVVFPSCNGFFDRVFEEADCQEKCAECSASQVMPRAIGVPNMRSLDGAGYLLGKAVCQ